MQRGGGGRSGEEGFKCVCLEIVVRVIRKNQYQMYLLLLISYKSKQSRKQYYMFEGKKYLQHHTYASMNILEQIELASCLQIGFELK